jgi:hypothetical protein
MFFPARPPPLPPHPPSTRAPSDVACEYPLKDMLEFHRARGAESTILVTKVGAPRRCCAVPCCAVLCCAALCCAVLCCGVLECWGVGVGLGAGVVRGESG